MSRKTMHGTTLAEATMISNATQRSIFRWIHIIVSIPILGYIYSPFEKFPDYAPPTRYVFASYNGPFGIVDVERPCPSTTDFEGIGPTRCCREPLARPEVNMGKTESPHARMSLRRACGIRCWESGGRTTYFFDELSKSMIPFKLGVADRADPGKILSRMGLHAKYCGIRS